MNFKVLLLAVAISFGRSYIREIRALIDQGEPQKALQIIEERLPEENGRKREQLLLLAVVASYESKNWLQALSYGEEYLTEFPETKYSGVVWFYIAKTNLQLGKKDDAALAFLRAYASPTYTWVKDSSYTYLFGLVELGTDLFHSLLSRGYLDKRIEPTNRVAVFVPQSGNLKSLGKEFMRGFLMAIPISVKLEVIDTKSDTEYASYVASTMKDSIFAVVVGPLTSMFAMNTAPRLDSFALFNLIPAASDLRLGSIGRFVVPFNYTTKVEVEKLVDFAIDSLQLKRFYILYPPDVEFAVAAFYFKELVQKKGGAVIESIKIPPNGLSFREEINIIQRISREEYPVVFIPAGNRGIYSMVSQMRFYDVNPLILGCEKWMSWRRKNELDIVIAAPEPGSPDVDRQEFFDRFLDLYGVRPSSIAQTGYDAGTIVKKLMESGPISSISAWQKADSIGIFRGISGNYILSKDRNFVKLYSFGQVGPLKGGDK